MPKLHAPTVIEQRALGDLSWLRLHSPALAEQSRPGHYLLLRCAPAGSDDPLLRRALFVAGADRAAGTLQLVFDPGERGLAWLARQLPGAQLDAFGPLGAPFALDQRTGNLLLAGQGDALAALIFLASAAGRASVVLLAAAAAPALLPPPYLLPPEVEYQTAIGNEALLALQGTDEMREWQGEGATAQRKGKRKGAAAPTPLTLSPPHLVTPSLIAWADQLCAAVPDALLRPLADAVRAQRLRWQPGFAQVALAGAMPCGTGACLGCLVETRDGWRTRCKDGPVFDLRAMR